MQEVFDFLQKCQVFYLATVENDQPRVRPFGALAIINGKMYTQTGKIKNVSHQLHENPKCEICAFDKGTWVRIECKLIPEEDYETKVAFLEANPGLKKMYSADDDNTEILCFVDAKATFTSFGAAPKTIEF